MKSVLIFVVSCWSLSFAFGNVNFPGRKRFYIDDPVFVTPYIESGQIELGQKLTQVTGLLDGVRSHAGFINVNKTFNSNMYFWYFPAEQSPETAPVVLWLQGGPGGSSLYGLFQENGVFYIEKNGELKKREHYWSQVLNVIYIDNPVGTGFSFTDVQEGYRIDETGLAHDLYLALLQFFRLFPHLRENDFFISGESYAGKYIPAIAYFIHINNFIKEDYINLKGMAIGNGFCDPENLLKYGDYLYQIGLIDSNERNQYHEMEDKTVQYIRNNDYLKAYEMFNSLVTMTHGPLNLYRSSDTFDSLFDVTGFHFVYNFLHDKDYSALGDFEKFLQTPAIRSSIHVGNLTYNDGLKVSFYLRDDFMRSVKPWIEELLEHYRVVFYNGQLDIIVAYPLTVNFLKTLKWSGTEEYKTAERKQWKVDGQLAGYTKTVGNLTEILVRNAGHMVPYDQPLWAKDLITRLAFNKPF